MVDIAERRAIIEKILNMVPNIFYNHMKIGI